MCPPFSDPDQRLFVRNATVADIPGIIDLSRRVYEGTGMYGYTRGPLTGQINTFPEGQFVAMLGDQVVGYCATFRIAGEVALARHDWTSITGNSTPVREEDGTIRNMAHVFLRDGRVYTQPKIHQTPNEAYWWNMRGGNRVNAIDTDCGTIGVLICYDAEFPELARHLVDQGVSIIFVPFCTDERQSYLRVRYCCQARAVENQVYVVLSGNVGNLPNVPNMEIQYGQSCILTPCDFPFARDGIAADTEPNVETVAFADLRPETLVTARNSGTVKNLQDRRHDLYSVNWRGE